jgi:hypothetical protein
MILVQIALPTVRIGVAWGRMNLRLGAEVAELADAQDLGFKSRGLASVVLSVGSQAL